MLFRIVIRRAVITVKVTDLVIFNTPSFLIFSFFNFSYHFYIFFFSAFQRVINDASLFLFFFFFFIWRNSSQPYLFMAICDPTDPEKPFPSIPPKSSHLLRFCARRLQIKAVGEGHCPEHFVESSASGIVAILMEIFKTGQQISLERFNCCFPAIKTSPIIILAQHCY